jgi:MATE family multidrug resistance protein
MPIKTIQIGLLTLTSIASVFVGRFNGAKEGQKVPLPVWQMVYFSLATVPFMLLFTFLGKGWLFEGSPVREEAVSYFIWLMPFAWTYPLVGALSSFFIGKGTTLPLLLASLLGNGVNILLNYVLIFGVEGSIPPLGVTGAAIATNIGMFSQIAILFLLFLRRQSKGTYFPSLDWTMMKECLSLGGPTALDRFTTTLAWSFFFQSIAYLGKTPLSVIAITQSMMLSFLFISQGIGRGVISMAANAIGSREPTLLNRTIFSAVFLNLFLFVLYGVIFIVFPREFATILLPSSVPTEGREEILALCVQASLFVWIAVLVDSLRWVFTGALTAIGETKYLLYVGSISLWIGAILPIYAAVTYWGMPVIYCWALSSLYYAALTLCYAYRFQQKRPVMAVTFIET